jgi:hypothetical protein
MSNSSRETTSQSDADCAPGQKARQAVEIGSRSQPKMMVPSNLVTRQPFRGALRFLPLRVKQGQADRLFTCVVPGIAPRSPAGSSRGIADQQDVIGLPHASLRPGRFLPVGLIQNTVVFLLLTVQPHQQVCAAWIPRHHLRHLRPQRLIDDAAGQMQHPLSLAHGAGELRGEAVQIETGGYSRYCDAPGAGHGYALRAGSFDDLDQPANEERGCDQGMFFKNLLEAFFGKSRNLSVADGNRRGASCFATQDGHFPNRVAWTQFSQKGYQSTVLFTGDAQTAAHHQVERIAGLSLAEQDFTAGQKFVLKSDDQVV